VEHRETAIGAKGGHPIFVGNLGEGEDMLLVQFMDLCTPCLKTVKNHLEAIGKKIDGLSPDRKPGEKDEAK
jgi:hypothetical protein